MYIANSILLPHQRQQSWLKSVKSPYAHVMYIWLIWFGSQVEIIQYTIFITRFNP